MRALGWILVAAPFLVVLYVMGNQFVSAEIFAGLARSAAFWGCVFGGLYLLNRY